MDFRGKVQFRTSPAGNLCIRKELGRDAEKEHFKHFSVNALSNDP